MFSHPFYYSKDKLIENISNFKKIFFYRVCGTGMGASAILLKEKGLEVAGGDFAFYPPMSNYLETTNIECLDLNNYSNEMLVEHLRSYDLIIVGNVVSKDSKHAKLIESLDIPFSSFPATLGAFILKDVNVVGISGTHGKTTSTYILAQMFEKMGINCGYFIGGVLENQPSAKLGDGSYFFIESDEYDSAYFEKFSKFQSYFINHLILTSLEFDHGDIFNNLDEILVQFESLISKVDTSCLISSDYSSSKNLFDKIKLNKKLLIGLNNKLGPTEIKRNKNTTNFKLKLGNKDVSFETNLFGEHNILNLSFAINYAFLSGLKVENIKSSINDLKLVRRRQEIRGYYKGALIIDDFAHHPRAYKMTIESIKTNLALEKKLIVILDPVSATSRSNLFQSELPECFAKSDELIIAKPIRETTVKFAKDLDCDKLKDDVKNKFQIPVSIYSELDPLKNKIESEADSSRVYLILSNGTCLDLWKSDFIEKIKDE
jgi:UDP-N-acetylmuramate: L-alanyl-gamma-D-glutamyl-meso-diaminopimelate ligase